MAGSHRVIEQFGEVWRKIVRTDVGIRSAADDLSGSCRTMASSIFSDKNAWTRRRVNSGWLSAVQCRSYFSRHQVNWQHLYILSPFKDVLLPQCLQSTLATSPEPQIQHILLTLHALRNVYLLTYLLTSSHLGNLLSEKVIESFNVYRITRWYLVCNHGRVERHQRIEYGLHLASWISWQVTQRTEWTALVQKRMPGEHCVCSQRWTTAFDWLELTACNV